MDIEYDDYIPNIILQNQFLERLSNYFKLPIFYYEDLYSNDAKYHNPLYRNLKSENELVLNPGRVYLIYPIQILVVFDQLNTLQDELLFDH